MLIINQSEYGRASQPAPGPASEPGWMAGSRGVSRRDSESLLPPRKGLQSHYNVIDSICGDFDGVWKRSRSVVKFAFTFTKSGAGSKSMW
jgi:hypothetical protein